MHAVPDGRHDHYDCRTALLRQLFAGRRTHCSTGDRIGCGKPGARQAGRQVRAASGFHSDDHRVDGRRDRAGVMHHRPCSVVDPVLHRTVHGRDSAVGCDEPSALDHAAQRRFGEDEPCIVAVRCVRRMHVGDRQSARFHAGRDFRCARLLVHRYVRGGRRTDVPDGTDHRTEVTDAAGTRDRHDPQGIPRARDRTFQSVAGRSGRGVRARPRTFRRQDGRRRASWNRPRPM